MLFIDESEMQEFSRQIARIFYQKATKEEMDQFIECSFVPLHLVKEVRKYLRNFEDTQYVVLSYSRLLLKERYKL